MSTRKPPPPRDPLPPPPPKRTREEAMREFEHACRAWFSCMLTPTERNDALQRAIEIANEGMKSLDVAKHTGWLASSASNPKRKHQEDVPVADARCRFLRGTFCVV